jgi:hypothetical protein
MQLAQEDSLRLNVLLNQNVQAIRIDEGKMLVYGLTEKGEAKIQLNPNCKDELYIKRIKEAISSHVLGSPGGYPVFLKRWTRMGQARAESLENLLKLGEPEAVVAVVGAGGITDEIARRAWWAMPNAENARRMLAREDVVRGEMGSVLAEFLLEFLPFEEEPVNVIESVRLVLQPGLIDEQQRLELWKKGQRKNALLVGFLATAPDDLPEETPAHPRHNEWSTALEKLAAEGNLLAAMLLRLTSAKGQAYMKTVESVLKKPANQDVVVALFKTLEEYFKQVRPHQELRREIDLVLQDANTHSCLCDDSCYKEQLATLYQSIPDSQPLVESMLVFSCIGEQLLNPIFALTDAVGSVMRRKIEPVTTPLATHLNRLLAK